MAKREAAAKATSGLLNVPTPLRVHGKIARDIGRAILSGRLRPGHVLDGEIEASAQRDVSRTAYREAIRILSAKGLIRSRPRTGTRVSEIQEWHLLDPDVLDWLFSGEPRQEIIHGLFELRSVVEPAAAAFAASRRSQAHCDEMRRALDEMTRHTLEKPEGRASDQAFHAALLAASGNPFIVSLTNGVTAAVNSLTEYKQRLAKIERDPVPDHWRVYDAIASKDPEAARDAMTRLIRLALSDMPARSRPRAAATSTAFLVANS